MGRAGSVLDEPDGAHAQIGGSQSVWRGGMCRSKRCWAERGRSERGIGCGGVTFVGRSEPRLAGDLDRTAGDQCVWAAAFLRAGVVL
jgi:hypothetical protein